MKMKRKSNAGLTLIELMLAVGIIAIAMIGILEYMERNSQRERAELAGEQMGLIGKALERLIVQEASNLKMCIPNNGTIQIPMSALYLTTGVTTVGSCQIVNRPYISWSGAADPINAFGSSYVINVKNQSNGYITGLVTLNAPVREGNIGTNVRYDWLGIAAKKIGANGGGTFLMTGATRMNGVGAGWSITNSDFGVVNQLGILGYKTSVGGEMDNVYLRLDGAYPMRGDLNAGNFSINNVTDLNVNGWINGNNALVNNLKASYVAANHIQTGTMNVSSTISTGGRNPNIRPDGWSGELIKTWDIFSEGSIAVGRTPGGKTTAVLLNSTGLVNAGGFEFNDLNTNFTRDGRGSYIGYLKDRLPRYVLRTVQAVNSGVSVVKPTCNAATHSTGAGNRAKIIVTPIFQNVYPEYEVTGGLTGGNQMYIYRSLTGRDQLQTYAVDAGGSWIVYANSYMGQNLLGAGMANGRVLAQTFCDFGD